MSLFTIVSRAFIVHCFIIFTILVCFANPACDSMNFFRYSTKHLSKKMTPSVSAILMECPKASTTPSCQRKIMVNIRVSPEDHSCKSDKYMLLDEVYDQKKQTRARLMSPYLIELTRGEPVLMYPLEFVKNLDCTTCGNRQEKAEDGDRFLHRTISNLKTKKTMSRIHGKSNIQDSSGKNLQTVNKNHLKVETRLHIPQELAVEAKEDGKRTNLDSINENPNENLDSLNPNNEAKHDNIKRNPQNFETLPFDQFDYEEPNHDFDVMVGELERNNEKIKQDILDILKPALLTNEGTDRVSADSNLQSQRIMQSAVQKQDEITSCGMEGEKYDLQCSTSTGAPPCQPCSTPQISTKPKCGKSEQPQTDIKQSRLVSRLNRNSFLGGSNLRLMPRLNQIGRVALHKNTLTFNSLRIPQNEEIPIQDISEDSSNSEDTDLMSNDENSDSDTASEQVGNLLTSVEKTLEQNREVQKKLNKDYNSLDQRKNRYPFYSTNQMSGKDISPEKEFSSRKSKFESPEVTKYTKHHLDPTRYEGPNSNKVGRYPSLLGRYQPHKDSKMQNLPSSRLRNSDRNKDAEFISYSNGYGLNVDSTDFLNYSRNQPDKIYEQTHDPPMPKLHHYFMHIQEPSGPRSLEQVDKKTSEKSVARLRSFSQYAPPYRKISTSKLQPVQMIELDPVTKELPLNDLKSSRLNSWNNKPFNNPTKVDVNNNGYEEKPEEVFSHEQLKQTFPPASDNSGKLIPDNSIKNEAFLKRDEKEEISPQRNSVPYRMNSRVANSGRYHENLGKTNNQPIGSESVPGETKDGDDYDYYEEDVSNLSDFPGVLTKTQKTKFPTVYQRPVIHSNFTEARESDDASPAVSDDIKELPKSASYQRKLIRSDRKNNHRGLTHYVEEKDAMPVDVVLADLNQHYIPARAPYDGLIDDPNLSTIDKIRLLELIDPQDAQLDAILRYLENDIQNSHIPYYLTKHDNIRLHPRNNQIEVGRADRHQKNIEKRSFALYDDMEIHDTDVDDDAAAKHLPVFDSFQQSKDALVTDHLKRSSSSESAKLTRSVQDIWYSVFNMSAPLQFLTTRVRIFRRKENSWWRIAPSITLTSLSGIYANANLSSLFSSHVEFYNLDKPLSLKHYKILIPHNQTTAVQPKGILAIDKANFDMNGIETIRESICSVAYDRLTSNFEDSSIVHKRNDKNSEDDSIHSVQDLGEFPSHMNILEQCKNDPSHLCLNMLDEETPGYKIKLQIPFTDNSLVYKDYYKVRITNIVVDGTINGAVQIITTLVNEALIEQEYDIVIANCPVTCGAKNVVHKIVPPHRGVTVAFLLPLQDNGVGSKHRCEVQIKTLSNQIISHRQMIIQANARCLCIWHCNCHCIKETVSTLISDMCQQLPIPDEKNAGFEEVESSNPITIKGILYWLLIMLLILLFLGCTKASLGCCIASIGRWKYNYLQPRKSYDESSSYRRFIINTMFCVCFPFVCLCRCFQPTEEDMLASTANWECSVVQKTIDSSFYGSSEDIEDEDSKEHLTFHQKEDNEDRATGGGGISSARSGIYTATVQDYLLERSRDEDEKQDNDFVLKTLHESRETIQQMDHCSEAILSSDERSQEAAELVRRLLDAKIVYRTFKLPVGNANLPAGQSFSIRGYFIPAIGPGYQFITHIPLRQHWVICPEVHSLRPLIPPCILLSKDFSRAYANRLEVLDANDLTVCPCVSTPCINVLVQDISMYTGPGDDEFDDYDEDDENEEDEEYSEDNSP